MKWDLRIFFLLSVSFLSFVVHSYCTYVGPWHIWHFLSGLWGSFHFCSFFSLLFGLDKSYWYIFKFCLLLYIKFTDSCVNIYLSCWVLVAACRIFNLFCSTWDHWFWHASSQLWHVGFSSLTKNQTQAPCIGSMESYPLEDHGSFFLFFFFWFFFFFYFESAIEPALVNFPFQL